MCNAQCKKYKDSHSIPKAFLRKLKVDNKFYDLQSYLMIHNLIINKMYKIPWRNLFSGKTSLTGVFYNLCDKCEFSEEYENKLGKNIDSSLTNFDYTRIYMKSICAAKYRVDFYNMFFKITKDSKTLNELKSDHIFRISEMTKELKNLTGENTYNQYNNSYASLYDSVFFTRKINLKFSVMCFIPYKKDANLCIFILSNRTKTRIIVISKNDRINRQNKANLYSYDSLDVILKVVLYELISQKLWGVAFDGSVDIEKIYDQYLAVQEKIKLIKKLNSSKYIDSYNFIEGIEELDLLLDSLSY